MTHDEHRLLFAFRTIGKFDRKHQMIALETVEDCATAARIRHRQAIKGADSPDDRISKENA